MINIKELIEDFMDQGYSLEESVDMAKLAFKERQRTGAKNTVKYENDLKCKRYEV